MSHIKITRIGLHHPQTGVITIASELINDKLFIGVSYCSPAEYERDPNFNYCQGYNKKQGTDLAIHRLADAKIFDKFILFNEEMRHHLIIQVIILSILDEEKYPRWAESLLVEHLRYPHGLKRYSKDYNFENGNNPVEIKKIVVNSEHAKDQLIQAFKYLHYLREIDTNFLAVNVLVHQYLDPNSIVVEEDYFDEDYRDMSEEKIGC
jgi:hypothetical protein